jgi:hypothetical protein
MSFITSFGILSKWPDKKLKKNVIKEELNRIYFSAYGMFTFNLDNWLSKKSSPF